MLYTTSRKIAGLIPGEVIGFFSWPNPSRPPMVMGSTQPLTEMSTRNIPVGKGRPAHKADSLTAISESIVWKMWESRYLITIWASMACYRDSFYSCIHASYHHPNFSFSIDVPNISFNTLSLQIISQYMAASCIVCILKSTDRSPV
jgi:hypothetical protein